jgi:hypothetical protein
MEALRDQRGLPWIESLRSDLVFGWRHLRKHPRTSTAAVLSLALAIGATMTAFRLVDAVLLRPLPVKEPHRLFAIGTTFLDHALRWDTYEYFDYPTYRDYARVAGDRADLMVVGMASPVSVRFRAGDEAETVYRQFVSGNVFGTFESRTGTGPADRTAGRSGARGASGGRAQSSLLDGTARRRCRRGGAVDLRGAQPV